MSENDNSFSQSGQRLALEWMTRYLRAPAKISEIRETLPCESDGKHAGRRARRLHSACLRHLRLYREVLSPFVSRSPKPAIEAALLLALAEIDLQECRKTPLVIDSWVDAVRRTSGAKPAGFINAVLRKASDRLRNIRQGIFPQSWGKLYSHPDWLVEKWISDFGPRDTERLLKWNQSTPALYASGFDENEEVAGLETTQWPRFKRLSHGITPEILDLLRSGRATIRDPATRIAEDLLCASRPGRVLDLCASPGGKSRALLSRPDGPGTLVAGDLEDRISLLEENLAPWNDRAAIQSIDLRSPHGCPPEWMDHFDGVLLDAPCSNTGVMQRKPDVKWRLHPPDIERMPPVQLAFLKKAARFVLPGGVLVYSTCSLEEEENRSVAESFLRSEEGQVFEMTAAIHALPFQSGHDGAGAYRFIRTKDR